MRLQFLRLCQTIPREKYLINIREKTLVIEEIDDIRIIRTSIYATKEKGFIKRLRNYLSFTFSSVITGVKHVGHQDVIITESPPLF